MKLIKRLIIKRALKQLKKKLKDDYRYDFRERERYGVADIILNENTREKMIVID